MCLYLRRLSRPKKAWRNIKCYKVVFHSAADTYRSPYIHTRICMEKITGKTLYKAGGPLHIKDSIQTSGERRLIEEGVIHTFVKIKDAIHAFGPGRMIFLCEIPRGTEYIRGECYWDSPSYGSKAIRFIKRIA